MKPVNLIEHPEGGRFREVFRSDAVVTTNGGRTRTALTHIYFSLNRGEVSRFHRVKSDEVWNLYQGAGVRIHTWNGPGTPVICTELSSSSNTFCHVVAAGTWQAAEPIGETILVGCSVGPGFEFEDFEMIAPASDLAGLLQAADQAMSKFILP
jgi:hypothetical protein